MTHTAEQPIIVVLGATGAQGGGLVRAILEDPERTFAVRAVTRNPESDQARALRELGAEVVAADMDAPESLRAAFQGAYGLFAVTNFWEHFSPERELAQAGAVARAARDARIRHVIWSTLEDIRTLVPLDDDRMPTLRGRYKVPHFDGKGEANALFTGLGVPTTFLYASFYWDNLVQFGMGPRPGPDGRLALTFPLGDKKMAGVAAQDIGRVAHGIFKRGPELAGQRIGVAGEHLSGAEMARILGEALGREVVYHEVSPEAYRRLGFPGADDLGNMFQAYRDFDTDFNALRDVERSRTFNPDLLDFQTWVARNRERLSLG